MLGFPAFLGLSCNVSRWESNCVSIYLSMCLYIYPFVRGLRILAALEMLRDNLEFGKVKEYSRLSVSQYL